MHALLISLVTMLLSALAAGPALADDDAEARRLYAEGKVEFAQRRFGEAAALFERAYALSGAPGLLFNMAQAHRLAGPDHCSEALALYRSYLAAVPAADNRLEVEERIAQLEPCAQPAPPRVVLAPAPSPPTPAPPAPAPSERQSARAAPLWLAGAGVALLAAGGAVYARAATRHAEAERECPCYPGTLDRWKRLTFVSYALLGTGGATLAGGVSWWMLALPTDGGSAALGVSARF